MQAPEVPGRNIGLMEFLFGREQIFGGYIVSEADVRLWRVNQPAAELWGLAPLLCRHNAFPSFLPA